MEARKALAEAIAARSLDELESALGLATRAQLPASSPELLDALKLKERLLEEQRMEQELLKVAESRDLPAVVSVINRAAALGMTVRGVLLYPLLPAYHLTCVCVYLCRTRPA